MELWLSYTGSMNHLHLILVKLGCTFPFQALGPGLSQSFCAGGLCSTSRGIQLGKPLDTGKPQVFGWPICIILLPRTNQELVLWCVTAGTEAGMVVSSALGTPCWDFPVAPPRKSALTSVLNEV